MKPMRFTLAPRARMKGKQPRASMPVRIASGGLPTFHRERYWVAKGVSLEGKWPFETRPPSGNGHMAFAQKSKLQACGISPSIDIFERKIGHTYRPQRGKRVQQ